MEQILWSLWNKDYDLWSLVSNARKISKSLDAFKSNIRQWEPDCPCRLCKN